MPNLKFLAPAVPEIWRPSQIFKSRSSDPPRPVWPNFAFCSLVPLVVNLHAKLEVFLALTVPEIWWVSQNSKSRSRDPFRTCKLGVAGDPIFRFPDPDLPIRYTTSKGLRWRRRVDYRWASPARGSRGAYCKFPAKSGAEAQPKLILIRLDLKILHLWRRQY